MRIFKMEGDRFKTPIEHSDLIVFLLPPFFKSNNITIQCFSAVGHLINQ